jgi:head-tail adaptor
MRVNHDGTLYNIRAVLPDPTLKRHITLMCETGIIKD